MHRATRRQLFGALVLAALAGLAAVFTSPAALLARLEGLTAHPLQFLVVLTAVYLVRPFLLWPVTAFSVVVGYLYGPVVGLPVALAGVGLSNLPPYLLARRAGTDAGLLGSVSDSARDLVGNVGERRGMLAARLLPLPGDAVSYAAGLTELSVGTFLLGTVVGEIPWAIVAVLAGDSMRTLALSEFQLSPQIVVAVGGLALLVLAGPLYSHVRGGFPE